MAGTFYGIGVGPGDPELLTLKAKRILEETDVLLVPKSKMEKRSIALTIVTGAIQKEWDQVDLLMPMTTDKEELVRHWKKAAEQIVAILEQGKDAAFITLGDPSLYSTFNYVLTYVKELAPDTKIEIVPGISSINSIAAWVQTPLAESEESLVVIPALQDKESLQEAIEKFDNVVLLKAGNQLEKVIEILEETKQKRKVFYASRCGFPDGFYTDTIEELRGKKLDYLSTLIIKKNV